LRDWFYGDFLGALRLDRTQAVGVKIIGNCVHPLGLMQELYDLDWWKSVKYGVLMKDGVPSLSGDPLWPEYMDLEAIEKKRREVPEPVFMAEYMNMPIVSENPIFEHRYFQSYEPGMIRNVAGDKITLRDMMIITALDPALSQRAGADRSALTTWGV
ncbi:unnamed protein product, partial [marine sediment metagenome]